MRWIVALVLAVAISAPASAEDDERLLETPPSQGIRERVEALEREWAEEVGIKEPADDDDRPEPAPLDEAHDAAHGTEPETPEAADAAPTPAVPDEPAPSKAKTPVEGPLRRAAPARPVVRGLPRPTPPEGAPDASKRPTAPEE